MDSHISLAITDEVTDEMFLEIVRKQILRGYLAGGFRDAAVTFKPADATGVINVTVEERSNVQATGIAALDRKPLRFVFSGSHFRSSPSLITLCLPSLKPYDGYSRSLFLALESL